jgi:hypothetical protein
MTARIRLIAGHPLTWALVAGLLTYFLVSLVIDTGLPRLFSVKDNADTANNWPGVGAVAAGGTFGASKFIKDMIDKTAKFPITTLKDMVDIARQPTDEAQADKALDVYFDMTGIKHAPPGSPGGDIKEAAERFKDFYKGKTDIP